MGFPQPQPAIQQQPFNMNPERTGNNQLGRPVPLFYGLHKTGVFWMTDLFADRTETVTKKVKTGKSSSENVPTGTNFYASWLAGIGYVSNFQLLEIRKGDATKWEGELLAGIDQSYWSIEYGENVPMVVYTGNQQAPDSIAIAKHNADHPAYRNVAYYRVDGILYGQNPVPPNYEFIFRSIIKKFVLDPENTTDDANNDRDEYHYLNDGCLIPEIIYDLLTNPYYGTGYSEEVIDKNSFVECAKTILEERIGYAAKFRERKNFDSAVKQMMSLIDAEWIEKDNKIGLKLNRSSDAVISIPESAFLSAPRIESASWHDNDIVNEVRIPYSPIERALEPTVAKATDQASIDKVGTRSKSFTFHGLRTQESAQAVANRFVKILSIPKVPYTLKLSSDYDYLRKGDRISPIFPKKRLSGSRILRIHDVTYGSTKRPAITVKAEVDHSIISTQEGDQDDIVRAIDYKPESATIRSAFLTDSQKGSFQDGFLICCARASEREDGALIYLSANATDYDLVANWRPFQLICEIVEWIGFDAGRALVKFKFNTEHDEQSFLDNTQAGIPDWVLVFSLSDAAGNNSMAPVWCSMDLSYALDITPDGSGGFIYGIVVESGQFGSDNIDYDTNQYPSQIAYMAPLENFLQYKTNQFNYERDAGNFTSDTDKKRNILASSTYRGERQTFEDSPSLEYDRVTNTQNPDWGGAPANYGGLSTLVTEASSTAPSDVTIDFVGGGTFNVTVEWGDSEPDTVLSSQNSPLLLTHNYAAAGNYTLIITTTDLSTGLENTRSVAVSMI